MGPVLYLNSNMSAVSKLVIFGSTGQTGVCCVRYAVKKGLNVTAFVRDPSRLPTELAPHVTFAQGSSIIKEDVSKAMEGQDGVIVALGTRNDLQFTTVMSESLKIILDTMVEKGISKISVVISSFLFWDPKKIPAQFQEVHSDHLRMLKFLKSPEYESLNWVAVLPPQISDEASSNGQFVVVHGSSPGRFIPKPDLGEFMVECLDQKEHYHEMCGLAFPVIQSHTPGQ